MSIPLSETNSLSATPEERAPGRGLDLSVHYSPGNQTPRSADEALELIRGLFEQALALVTLMGAAMPELVIALRTHGQPAGQASDQLSSRKLTAQEAAEYLGVTPATINGWCIEQRFPGAQSLGRAGWRIPREALDDLDVAVATRGRTRRVRRDRKAS